MGKAINKQRFKGVITSVLQTNEEKKLFAGRLAAKYGMLTQSRKVLQIIGEISGYAATNCLVLVLGPTGTGKELMARAVHTESGKKKDMVIVNTPGISDQMVISALFGHEQYAFTDARKKHEGYVRKAQDSSLFFDEFGDISTDVQSQILRFIQEGTFTPLGSDVTLTSNARLIFATNRNIEKRIKEGKFRSDLYFRISHCVVTLPALNERREDIILLTDYFISKYAKEYNKRILPYDHSELEEILCGYDWPGNIRQLEGMCKGVVLTCKPGGIIQGCSEYMVTKNGRVEDHNLGEILKSIRHYPCFKEMKDTWLKAALDKADGNLTQAAAWAQMDKRNFRRMAKAAGIYESK